LERVPSRFGEGPKTTWCEKGGGERTNQQTKFLARTLKDERERERENKKRNRKRKRYEDNEKMKRQGSESKEL
jgi:hypothetical protein